MVITSALHAEGLGFEPRPNLFFLFFGLQGRDPLRCRLLLVFCCFAAAMIRAEKGQTPWVQLILKIVEVVSAALHTSFLYSLLLLLLLQVVLLLAVLLAAAWTSQGIRFTDLNMADYNVRSAFEYLIVVGIFGVLYSMVALIIFYPFKRDFPPAVVCLSPLSVLPTYFEGSPALLNS